ncbi:MAG: hypothetical protein DRP78_05785 [Candidatus Omnitrophota bacterium]|nr:MAG: hypothetical protein DRP78_05785 [Candidatus Omnitrophota bacterium]
MLKISGQEFDILRKLMYKHTGVYLKESKKPLVISRLRTRLEGLKLNSFSEYIIVLENHGIKEMEYFVNALTTNETYFFRHVKQFNYLFEKIFPEIIEKKRLENKRQIRIWSAASSTGEEPYSVAIACREFFKNRQEWKVKIFATDVNSKVLADAKAGFYPERSLKEMSAALILKYFSDGVAQTQKKWKQFKLHSSIIESIDFRAHNLLEIFAEIDFDIIFLRNVLIYFDQEIKQKVINNLQNNLLTGGYLFISPSETLNDVQSSFESVFSSIYRKVNTQDTG